MRKKFMKSKIEREKDRQLERVGEDVER